MDIYESYGEEYQTHSTVLYCFNRSASGNYRFKNEERLWRLLSVAEKDLRYAAGVDPDAKVGETPGWSCKQRVGALINLNIREY